MSVCPSGCVRQAVLAPGSKVTLAHETRAGSVAVFSGSIHTAPVKKFGPVPSAKVVILRESVS